MSNKKISIITVTYNSEDKIENFLVSISKNLDLIKDVIIIENDSKGKKRTEDICRAYKKILPIRFYASENVGFGKSCNFGASKSSADYLLFLNPDTEVNSKSIKILYDHAIMHRASMIGGKSTTFAGKQHLTVVRKPNLNIGLFEFSNLGKVFKTERGHRDFYYLDKIKISQAINDQEVDGLGGAYLMIKKNSFEALKGFDENFFMYLEDVDLSVRAKKLGMKVIYCPHSVIKHIGGASSDNKYKISHQAWFDSRKYYYKKHFGFFTNLLIQPLYIVEEFLLKKIRRL